MKTKEKVKRKFPNALIVVFYIMIAAMILTWIIPAGKYETLPDSTVLDPASYHTVEQSPVGPWGLMSAVFGGMSSAANIIVFTFLVGGYFNVLMESKSVDGFISYLTRRLGTRSTVVLPVLILIMSILGATGVMANPVVAVIPIGLLLSRKLGLDRLTAVAIMFLAAYSGYATSPICAMTVQVAQKIADLPMLSGFGFRCVIWVVFFVPTLLFIMRYVHKVQAQGVPQNEWEQKTDERDLAEIEFTFRHALALMGLIVGLGVYVYGSLALGWGMATMATVMLLVAVFAAFVTGMGFEGFINGFLSGARQMTFSAMLIGLASGVSYVLNSGNILHSIVFGMGVLLNNIPHVFAGPVMFWFNLLFNFLVNSGSGQATVIMPIMAPLADVVGVTRQAAVTAFQLGDGLSNVIFPTSGTLMACLAVAGIDFKKWVKFVSPLFALWTIMGTITVILVVASGVA